ncbi:hypothetical protein D3C76_1015680 [compost metagenome]
MQNGGDETARYYNAEGKEIQAQAGDTKGGEKPRANLNADGVDEEDQAEFLNEVQHFRAERQPKLIGEMADKNAAKQYPANAKSDTADFNIANPQPNHRNQGQHANR